MADAITKLKLDDATLRAMAEKALKITALSFKAREKCRAVIAALFMILISIIMN